VARMHDKSETSCVRAELERVKCMLSKTEKELSTLLAALDHVDSGLLILDDRLHAVYSNPALHRAFKSFDAQQIRSGKFSYEELLRDAQRMSAVDLENYVAKRIAWVMSGDPTPMDLKMSDGRVLRSQLAVLPNGGRMIIYADVTDVVQYAEEMERLAITDGMTGIYNRRHFLALADHEWAKACRYNRPLALLLVDIDHFKSINDNYGHQIGDDVIIHLARFVSSCKREVDVLARLGGEEFVLLLPDANLQQAKIFAERLRNEVATHPVALSGRAISVTISVGVAARSSKATSVSRLISLADEALYESKRGGRNRVTCSPDAIPLYSPNNNNIYTTSNDHSRGG
jgi:diguanylate cyclase (GGDEF)-like protein